MISLIQEDLEEEEYSRSNCSVYQEDSINEDDVCFYNGFQSYKNNSNNFSFHSEISDNDHQDDAQIRLIEHLKLQTSENQNLKIDFMKKMEQKLDDLQDQDIEVDKENNQQNNGNILTLKQENLSKPYIQLNKNQYNQTLHEMKFNEDKELRKKSINIVDQEMLNEMIELLQQETYQQNKQLQQQMYYLMEQIPYFQQILKDESSSSNFSKLMQYFTLQQILDKNFLFHYGDDADYLYILLSGSLVVYVPKTDAEIQKEIKLKYNLLLNEKISNQIVVNENKQSTLSNSKNKLKILQEQKDQYSNQEEEEFLREVCNNSEKYFKFEQQQCIFRRAAHIYAGEVFGTQSLGKLKQRTSTIIATSDCVLAKIQGWQYVKILKAESEKREFLSKCLRQLLPAEIKKEKLDSLAYLFKERSLHRHQVIFKQNDLISNKFYFILKGNVDILKTITEKEGVISQYQNKLDKFMQNKVTKYDKSRQISALVLQPGEFFGLEDLLEKRSRSITALSLSSETVIFELERSILNEVNSTSIIDSIREIGKQRLERYEARILQAQQFSSELSQQKSLKTEVSQDIQRIAKEKIIQNSLSYQFKVKEIRNSQKENSDKNNKKENLDIELDPSDILDYQKVRQKIQRQVDVHTGKFGQGETYYQKNIRPEQISGFDSCLSYIKTVPSFSQLKTKQFLPSLKESTQIFEEEKLKMKVEQYKKDQRRRSLEQLTNSNFTKNFNQSCYNICTPNKTCYSNGLEDQDQTQSVDQFYGSCLSQRYEKNIKSDGFIPKVYNSPQTQLSINCQTSRSRKFVVESYAYKKIQLNKNSNQFSQTQMSLQNKQLQQGTKDDLEINLLMYKNKNVTKKRNNSLQLVKQSIQKYQKLKQIDNQIVSLTHIQSDFMNDNVLQGNQYKSSQVKENIGQIDNQLKMNQQEGQNNLANKKNNQQTQFPSVTSYNDIYIHQLEQKPSAEQEQLINAIKLDNSLENIKKKQKYSLKLIQKNKHNDIKDSNTKSEILINDNIENENEINQQQNEEEQQKQQSNNKLQIQLQQNEQINQNTDQFLIQQSNKQQIEQLIEPLQDQYKEEVFQANQSKQSQEQNQQNSVQDLVNFQVHAPINTFQKESINLIRTPRERQFENQLNRRRNLSETQINQKFYQDDIQPLLKQITNISNKIPQQSAQSLLTNIPNNVNTSQKKDTEQQNKIQQVNDNNFQSINSNQKTSNDSIRIFAEDSFIIQSYKSLASNSQLRNKILSLAIVDEGAIQKNEISSGTRIITNQSNQSKDDLTESKQEIKNTNIQKNNTFTLKSPLKILNLKQFTQENANILQKRKSVDLSSNIKHSSTSLKNIQPYIQSVIIPDFKYTNPLYIKIKQEKNQQ